MPTGDTRIALVGDSTSIERSGNLTPGNTVSSLSKNRTVDVIGATLGSSRSAMRAAARASTAEIDRIGIHACARKAGGRPADGYHPRVAPSPIRLPSGVRDFLPRAAARRRSLAARVMDVFDAWSYARVITPLFECADVLERGLGDGARAAAIRFVEPGTGEVVALRPDITPQIARIVATRLADVPGPLRLCYEGAVTRLAGDRGQREILQAGIELVEASEPDGDAEVLAVAAEALAGLGLADVELDVGHVHPRATCCPPRRMPMRVARWWPRSRARIARACAQRRARCRST